MHTSSSIRHRFDVEIPRGKFVEFQRRNYIDFERRIYVEIMTSVRRGYFDVHSTFKIDEISVSFLRGFFYVVSTFIESQFAYCSLIWIFCQRSSNIRINHLHERALRIVYKDNELTFEDLLKKDNSVSIHHKNIRLLDIELYKVKYNLSAHLMSEIFNLRNIDYNLRSQTDFKPRPCKHGELWFKVIKISSTKNMGYNSP